MILHILQSENNGIHRFKAPIRHMYEIHSIYGSIFSGGSNFVSIVDYLLEDEVTSIPNTVDTIALITSNIAGTQFQFNLPVPAKTKFISVGPGNDSTVFSTHIYINYELIKASKTELLMEWFRKGR